MNLEELRAQARAVATRMEARTGAALTANRDLTADEEAAQTADEAELADLKGQITAAEGSGDDDKPADATAVAVAAERERILALADLCPSSVVATPLRTAIESGQTAGAFAIGLAQAAKGRGASMDQLRDGAVQSDQLPSGSKPGAKSGLKAPTGLARGAAIVAKAAQLGHKGVAHLAPKG